MLRTPSGPEAGRRRDEWPSRQGLNARHGVDMSKSSEPVVPSTAKVVVGIDGSDNSHHALAWALAKRCRLGEVTPVMVFQPQSALDLIPRLGRPEEASTIRTAAEAELRQAIDASHDADSGMIERARVIEGYPGVGLVDAAEDADLLVVGTRGRSSLATMVLGSVSEYCAKHASVPVAVVPEGFPADRPLSTIVVGVDGSGYAEAALRWAIDHVEPDGRIIAAGALSIWGYMAGDFDPPADLMEQQIRRAIEQSVERVTGTDYRGPRITIQVSNEDARVALRDLAAAEADMLVIGARGTSGVAYLVLGSVSTALIHHPTVPTVLIPSPSPDSPGSPA